MLCTWCMQLQGCMQLRAHAPSSDESEGCSQCRRTTATQALSRLCTVVLALQEASSTACCRAWSRQCSHAPYGYSYPPPGIGHRHEGRLQSMRAHHLRSPLHHTGYIPQGLPYNLPPQPGMLQSFTCLPNDFCDRWTALHHVHVPPMRSPLSLVWRRAGPCSAGRPGWGGAGVAPQGPQALQGRLLWQLLVIAQCRS